MGATILEISFKKKQVKSGDPYPWLEPNVPREKNDIQKIMESTLTFHQSYLSKEEQEEVYNLLVKYWSAFSLRDEIGTCPNIEVGFTRYGCLLFSYELSMLRE